MSFLADSCSVGMCCARAAGYALMGCGGGGGFVRVSDRLIPPSPSSMIAGSGLSARAEGASGGRICAVALTLLVRFGSKSPPTTGVASGCGLERGDP